MDSLRSPPLACAALSPASPVQEPALAAKTQVAGVARTVIDPYRAAGSAAACRPPKSAPQGTRRALRLSCLKRKGAAWIARTCPHRHRARRKVPDLLRL